MAMKSFGIREGGELEICKAQKDNGKKLPSYVTLMFLFYLKRSPTSFCCSPHQQPYLFQQIISPTFFFNCLLLSFCSFFVVLSSIPLLIFLAHFSPWPLAAFASSSIDSSASSFSVHYLLDPLLTAYILFMRMLIRKFLINKITRYYLCLMLIN